MDGEDPSRSIGNLRIMLLCNIYFYELRKNVSRSKRIFLSRKDGDDKHMPKSERQCRRPLPEPLDNLNGMNGFGFPIHVSGIFAVERYLRELYFIK
uniref:Uncharacterized protein n=1 Tax=Onchocerca volvulus TaxID=6282 RepID=A0A8R1TVM0_ONCVO